MSEPVFAPYRSADSHVLTREENARGGSSTSTAKREAAAANGRAGLEEFKQTDASREASRRGGRVAAASIPPEVRHRAGVASESQRWRCDDCGRVSSARGIANHQRLSRVPHSGRTRIDTTEENA